jgi:hypothetical protein
MRRPEALQAAKIGADAYAVGVEARPTAMQTPPLPGSGETSTYRLNCSGIYCGGESHEAAACGLA